MPTSEINDQVPILFDQVPIHPRVIYAPVREFNAVKVAANLFIHSINYKQSRKLIKKLDLRIWFLAKILKKYEI